MSDKVLKVWWRYLTYFISYREYSRGGGQNLPPPPPSGARVKFGDSVITEYDIVINLGLTMDKHLTYEAHVDHLVQKSTGTLLALSHAKHVLPSDTLPTVVSGLVMSAIRYCLSVYGTHGSTQLQRIQRIINFGARVVSGRKKRDHISDVVRDLQWLNAKQLVSYHEMCLLKRVLITGLPPDIAAMFTRVEHTHGTRQQGQLRPPRAVSNSGLRRFSVRASKQYNKLSENNRNQLRLQVFKRHLKRDMLRGLNAS